MRLVCPKDMTTAQERGLKLCLESAHISLTRNQINALVAEQIETIEKGVHFIDRGLPVPGAGTIDAVAIDSKRRVLLINVADNFDVRFLCEVFARTAWAEENFKVLEHVAGGEKLHGLRVWVLAEYVSPDVCSVGRRMRADGLEIFECRCVNLAQMKWIVVRKMDFDARNRTNDDDQLASQKCGENFELNSVLTKDEVEDFFDANNSFDSGEEVTCRIPMF